ncbi:MAG: prolyl oligopeptidase family serine peptidase [Betaproteobacteria bacterium]
MIRSARSPIRLAAVAAMTAVAAALPSAARAAAGLRVADLPALQSVGEVRLSPDGSRVVYSVVKNDRPGRPYTQLWVMDVATGNTKPLLPPAVRGGSPRWSPDGGWIAFTGSNGKGSMLMLVRPDGTGLATLAPMQSTNHPLPSTGDTLTWAPDGHAIAFVSSTPGPEREANGDPMVITRYLYKPTAGEGMTRFNDNRRLHIFLVDIASRKIRQLTTGSYYEHSLAWSPRGDVIAFISNHGADPDRFFNYDVFTIDPASGTIRQLTQTKNAEYRPTWSPDGRSIAYLGTKRPLTSSETTMEDTHVWLMNADGSNRREIGEPLDARQGFPGWSTNGRFVYFTAQERGSVRLYRIAAAGGAAEPVAPQAGEPGRIGSWSTAGDTVAFAEARPSDEAELFVARGGAAPVQRTKLNTALLGARTVAPVDAFTFKSFDGTDIEAFLTRPLTIEPSRKYPLITLIHGGPHGQQGPAFDTHAQVYAAHGFATLMVNYRGSTGYGQKLADAIFKDQDGGEGRDVLAGVDAALARYPWIDADHLGIEGTSYGGQLTDWLITQTDRFKAAIPTAGISNLVSFNYMAYYHDYLAVEFGAFPTEDHVMDELWKRSAIRYANQVKTPTMFCHGENDNDVPIAEAEQFYIALKDVGVETVMVRYPREGHGVRETRHVQDWLTRSMKWYDDHFGAAQRSQAR